MLSFDPDREPVTPKHAATVLVLRDGEDGLEVFCVRRHAKSAFMGGAVVFPGGKLDAADADPAWAGRSDGLHPRAAIMAEGPDQALGLAVCACRETLEEGALLPSTPALSHEQAEAMRQALAAGGAFDALVEGSSSRLATEGLVPFARWVTPTAEQRRYDARFFVARLPEGQRGQHDNHEVVGSTWGTPQRILEAFAKGDLWLAPPTTRCLELLRPMANVDAALGLAAEQSLLPICPELIPGPTIALALPGDPKHPVSERRVAGSTRFVMDEQRLVSDPAFA